jgi:hypothetical protein
MPILSTYVPALQILFYFICTIPALFIDLLIFLFSRIIMRTIENSFFPVNKSIGNQELRACLGRKLSLIKDSYQIYMAILVSAFLYGSLITYI